MKITFFSNFMNHHQLPLCRAFMAMPGVEFKFVATIPIEKERLELGYEDMNQMEFVVRPYESRAQKKEAMRLAKESDMIIHGAAPEKYVIVRYLVGKPSFKYSERWFKRFRSHFSPKNWGATHWGRPVNMLGASAFIADDAARIGAYKDRCYRWGYFPQVKQHKDIEGLINAKKPATLLWAGRMIDWKHADHAILVADRLKKEGYDITLNMISTGKLEDNLRDLITEKGLDGVVNMLGSMSPEKVREYMEEASVYMFTSDKQEGWGAVLNESMNSGCAVVASHAIGSVPFLVEDGVNGMIYRSGDVDDLYKKVKYLLDNPDECKAMGVKAYKTLAEQWNAENAAARFVKLAEAVLAGEKAPDLFPDGVCSKAPRLKDNWL